MQLIKPAASRGAMGHALALFGLWAALLPALPAATTMPTVDPTTAKTTLAQRWQAVTSPSITYENDQSGGGRLFAQAVPHIDPYVHDIAGKVGRFLYLSPDEVPAFERLTLKIFSFDGIAWKSGDPPHITVAVSSDYLLRYHREGGNVAEEVRGILFHEMTHAYQHANGMSSSAVEGVADLVRYCAGYIPTHFRFAGGHWTDGYKTTAFFLAWLQENQGYADLAYVLNQSALPGQANNWSWQSAITNATCQSPDTLWHQYQTWLKANP